MGVGSLIIVNGNSSAGKSTVARLMQAELLQTFLLTGIDDFLHRLPDSLVGPAVKGVSRGWELTFNDGEMAGVPRTTPLGYQIINGIYAAIAAYCRAGNNAIVDAVMYDSESVTLARENFAGLKVFSVGLHCELAEAKRRERGRGDRAPGGAAAFDALVHLHLKYDFSIDVTNISAADAAHLIVSEFLERPEGTAFWASPKDHQVRIASRKDYRPTPFLAAAPDESAQSADGTELDEAASDSD